MKKLSKVVSVLIIALAIFLALMFIASLFPDDELPDQYSTDEYRLSSIPSEKVKYAPSNDLHPPVLHSNLWHDPVPMDGPINTAGLEDSPFITPDGKTFFFFFTPDADQPVEKQLTDHVTGIWMTNRSETGWNEPERVRLSRDGMSLDGCPTYVDGVLYFCSVREGVYTEIDMYTAHMEEGAWGGIKNMGQLLNQDYEIGEMHISADGLTLYFHSTRAGGKGGTDIWISRYVDEQWQTPENMESINTEANEGYPFLSPDGTELWFTRTYLGTPAVFYSSWDGTAWSKPTLIVSMFAGEPTLDAQGNLYFVHHYFANDQMLEADIYVAFKK